MSAYEDFLASRRERGIPAEDPVPGNPNSADFIAHPEPGPKKVNKSNHQWRQQGGPGGMLVCRGAGDHEEHGYSVAPNQLLTGIDANGYPILKSISDMPV